MIGALKLRVALGLVLATTVGPAAVSDALPSTAPTRPVTRVEFTDNSAYLVYGENGLNGAGSSTVSKPGDPLTFMVFAGPPAPGTNAAHLRVELVNNTSGEVRFPGGLVVRVILRNGQRTLVRHPATSLAPGAGVQAETTAPLPGFGHYSVSAFTVAQFAG